VVSVVGELIAINSLSSKENVDDSSLKPSSQELTRKLKIMNRE
jgi:hypothetical protein